jgi:hypothetical protein
MAQINHRSSSGGSFISSSSLDQMWKVVWATRGSIGATSIFIIFHFSGFASKCESFKTRWTYMMQEQDEVRQYKSNKQSNQGRSSNKRKVKEPIQPNRGEDARCGDVSRSSFPKKVHHVGVTKATNRHKGVTLCFGESTIKVYPLSH